MTGPERGTRPERAVRDRILTWAVPVLLVVVALVQLGRAHTLDQSSWSGAGFGMFATYESGLTRFALIDVRSPSGTVETIPAPAGEATTLALVVPTPAKARALAEAVGPVVAGAVTRVSVWGIRFDPGTGRVAPFLLTRVELR